MNIKIINRLLSNFFVVGVIYSGLWEKSGNNNSDNCSKISGSIRDIVKVSLYSMDFCPVRAFIVDSQHRKSAIKSLIAWMLQHISRVFPLFIDYYFF